MTKDQIIDELRAALEAVTPAYPPADAKCHAGIVRQEDCAHCERIKRGRLALALRETNAGQPEGAPTRPVRALAERIAPTMLEAAIKGSDWNAMDPRSRALLFAG